MSQEGGLSGERANAFADAWIAAWNSHDLEAILSHYRDDVVFTSPRLPQPAGATGGTLRGIGALRGHFARALEAFPDLRFQLYHVAAGLGSVTLVYRSVNDLLAAETAVLDADLRIARVRAHYASG